VWRAESQPGITRAVERVQLLLIRW